MACQVPRMRIRRAIEALQPTRPVRLVMARYLGEEPMQKAMLAAVVWALSLRPRG